ncbi:MAG: DUF5063 domain-containing protein [Robiginitomaculum sp.]|nr:DUF5063 domain-containing protein [Robiginitomaculum sp.]
MTSINYRKVIDGFLSVVSSEDEEIGRIQKLIKCLDELAVCTNDVDYCFDEKDYAEPPDRDYIKFREYISKKFPSLGFYNIALEISEELHKSSLSIGDAIDDIVDIAQDLQDVLWRFDNTSPDDALFYFEFTFRSHWGQHLRELQLYLHDLTQ